ncbi:MAG: hypothetical protein RR914_05295 [Oscillospiraceae bacterium]
MTFSIDRNIMTTVTSDDNAETLEDEVQLTKVDYGLSCIMQHLVCPSASYENKKRYELKEQNDDNRVKKAR